ncbi:MAG: redox-sensitive transcriptional activator SoxR [Pseudomonadales bacterium]
MKKNILRASDLLSIGKLAERVGITVSAIRFYESRGLIKSNRNRGGQRRFRRSDVRRLSFVLIAQQLGFSIKEIAACLEGLPLNRTPTKADWTSISQSFRKELDRRIATMVLLREKLDGCIGCGCLSLKNCQIYNKDDRASIHGAGPRYLLGDRPDIDKNSVDTN